MKFCRIQTYIIITLFMFLALPGMAQKISVANFYLAETDLTANTEGTIVYDQNGDKCALIKVETTQRGFSFDGGSLGITKVEEHPGEVWLYVPHGLKRLTISHPQLGILRNHDLDISVQEARTYVLELTTDRVITTVFDDTRTQILELNVAPVNATVILNGVRENADSQGRIVKELSFGSYNCRVMADNYHSHETVININNTENRHVVNVSLKPAFGYLQIITSENEYEGAEIFVDDNKVGILPMNNIPIKSGAHKVTISNSLYLPYEKNVIIQDSTVYRLSPDKLVANHAIVTINAAKEVSVWIDNEYKGLGVWKGPLAIGPHLIECRKESHHTTTKHINVVSTNSVTFYCEVPRPIYGMLNVTSVPTNADVFIDGKKVGQTPFYTPQVLIGKHEITFSKDGYKTENRNINIKENESQKLSVELSSKYIKQISSYPRGAFVYLDNEYKGTTPCTIQTDNSGTYNLELRYGGYKNYRKKIKINGTKSDIFVTMKMNEVYKPKPNRIESDEFYISTNYRTCDLLQGLDLNMGLYWANFNMEVGWILNSSDNFNESFDIYSDNILDGGVIMKFGYGFRLNNRFRLTPQFGLEHLYFYDEYGEETDGHSAFVSSLKLDYALNTWFGLSIIPEYIVQNYNYYDDVDENISLFNIKLGIYIYL